LIPGWHPQVVDSLGCIEDQKSSKRAPLKLGRPAANPLSLKESFGFTAAETSNHDHIT